MDADETGDLTAATLTGSTVAESPGPSDVVPTLARGAALTADTLPPLVPAAAGAVLLGLVWWQLGPLLRRASDAAEASVAGDAAFVLPALVAGLVTASWLVVRPGPRPLVRFAVTVLYGIVGSCGAWGVGRALGADPLRATGVLLVWPTLACLGVLVASIIAMITAPE